MQLATQVVASMLALEAIDSTSDIKLYINSSGEHLAPCYALLTHVASPPASGALFTLQIAKLES